MRERLGRRHITRISRSPIEATVGDLVDAQLPPLRRMTLADGDEDERWSRGFLVAAAEPSPVVTFLFAAS